MIGVGKQTPGGQRSGRLVRKILAPLLYLANVFGETPDTPNSTYEHLSV